MFSRCANGCCLENMNQIHNMISWVLTTIQNKMFLNAKTVFHPIFTFQCLSLSNTHSQHNVSSPHSRSNQVYSGCKQSLSAKHRFITSLFRANHGGGNAHRKHRISVQVYTTSLTLRLVFLASVCLLIGLCAHSRAHTAAF